MNVLYRSNYAYGGQGPSAYGQGGAINLSSGVFCARPAVLTVQVIYLVNNTFVQNYAQGATDAGTGSNGGAIAASVRPVGLAKSIDLVGERWLSVESVRHWLLFPRELGWRRDWNIGVNVVGRGAFNPGAFCEG